MPQTQPIRREWLQCLGLRVSGDLGDLTLYTTRRGRTVAYPRAPPTVPATSNQVTQRTRFATAVANWNATTPETRQAFETASLKTYLCMTGHNVWIHFSFSQDAHALDTLARQSGVTLPMPPSV